MKLIRLLYCVTVRRSLTQYFSPTKSSLAHYSCLQTWMTMNSLTNFIFIGDLKHIHSCSGRDNFKFSNDFRPKFNQTNNKSFKHFEHTLVHALYCAPSAVDSAWWHPTIVYICVYPYPYLTCCHLDRKHLLSYQHFHIIYFVLFHFHFISRYVDNSHVFVFFFVRFVLSIFLVFSFIHRFLFWNRKFVTWIDSKLTWLEIVKRKKTWNRHGYIGSSFYFFILPSMSWFRFCIVFMCLMLWSSIYIFFLFNIKVYQISRMDQLVSCDFAMSFGLIRLLPCRFWLNCFIAMLLDDIAIWRAIAVFVWFLRWLHWLCITIFGKWNIFAAGHGVNVTILAFI